MKAVPSISAMAFYHKDGLAPAWKQAARFAGQDGRIATLPDIINARLNQKLGTVPWEKYFTTRSAEYMGRTRGGSRILIVAHNVGPMATLDSILKAYSFHFKDKTRQRSGGRITYEEFYALESGKFGDVAIVDLESYFRRYEYPFGQHLRVSEALTDPLVKARLGSRTEEYVLRHATFAREWHLQEAGVNEKNRYQLPNWEEYLNRTRRGHLRYSRENSDPLIIEIGDAANCSYAFRSPEGGYVSSLLNNSDGPIAHLLSIGQLMNCHMYREDCDNLACDIGCHEWWNGVRLIAVRNNSEVTDIHQGVDSVSDLIRRNWRKLMQPLPKPGNVGFRMLMKVGKQWFTQYLKQGARMDTHEPEFLVTSIEQVGQPVEFITTVGGYHGFVKYDIKEVKAIAPREANAYTTVGEWEIVNHKGNPDYHRIRVQFHRVEVDSSQRLIREDELCNDYETLMQLIA